MKDKNLKLTSEKGAITLFVLLSCLFFLLLITSVGIYVKNKSNAVESEYQQIKQSYGMENRNENNTGGEIEDNTTKKLIEINIEEMTLDGASLITATIEGETVEEKLIATSADVKWSSSDEEVATVTKNGIVICGDKTGTATITCTGNGVKKTCSVTSYANKVYTNNTTANCTITGATSGFAYNQPIIPVGFTAINTIDAKWTTSGVQTDYNKGLVIMDDKGNQFVWVPIDGTNVTYEDWYTGDLIESEYPEGSLPATDKATAYEGFWIGRYETGLDVDMGDEVQRYNNTEVRDVIGKPIIVEGAAPWGGIDYANSKANAANMYTTNNNDYQSGLVNRTAWDTTMKWMENVGQKNVTTDSTSWGNYVNNMLVLDRYKTTSETWEWGGSCNEGNDLSVKGRDLDILLRTGASTSTKVLNISDMAGNLLEWIYEMGPEFYDARGGSFGGTGDMGPGAYSDSGQVNIYEWNIARRI